MAERKLRYLQNTVGWRKDASAVELADAIGTSRQTIHNKLKRPFDQWEIGELRKVAKFLGWNLHQMIDLADVFERAHFPEDYEEK